MQMLVHEENEGVDMQLFYLQKIQGHSFSLPQISSWLASSGQREKEAGNNSIHGITGTQWSSNNSAPK